MISDHTEELEIEDLEDIDDPDELVQRKKTIKNAKLKIAKTRKLEQLNITVNKESNSYEDSE